MDQFILMCNCGCDTGLIFRADKEEIFISLVDSYFSNRQKPLRTYWSEKFRLLFTKKDCISEIMIREEDVRDLVRFLQEHPLSTAAANGNSSFLRIENLFTDDDNADCYSLTINSDMPKRKVLFNKLYRAGELVYGEKEKTDLINNIEALLKKDEAEK